jgi:phage tail sheath gpL-like
MLFNFIPGSGLIAPGVMAEVNSAGQYTSNSKTLVLGIKSSAGSLSANSPVICSTIAEAGLYAGVGSQLYETFRQARRHAPEAEIWIAALPVTGAAGIWVATLADIPAAGGAWTIEIAGRKIVGVAMAGDTASTVAAALVAAVNSYVDLATMAYLPVTAAAVAGVVTLTARHAGAILDEIEVTVDANQPANIFNVSGVCTITHPTAATGPVAVSTLLGALGDQPFDWLVSPFSDSDSLDSADSALSDAVGRWAYNTQLYGHYFGVNTANLAGQVTFGLARNGRHTSTLARWASPTPSYEWVGAYVGAQIPWLSDDTNGNAARNQSDRALDGIRPPRDRATWPNYTTRNALLQNGMSTWKVNGAGQVVIDKCITHYRTNAAGQPDEVFRNIQAIAVVMHVLRYMRAMLSYKHANKSLAASNPGNLEAVSTPRDIQADTIAAYGECVDRGLVQDKQGFSQRLQVEIDKTNPSRVNLQMDPAKVNPLDIIAINARVWSQYRAA